MRSGNRAETPSVRHERGKSWRRTPGGMFVRLVAITGYPRRLYSIVYTHVDSPFHVLRFLWAKEEAPMTSFHLRVRFWGNLGRRALFNTVLVYFLLSSRNRALEFWGVSLALHSHPWIMHRRDIMFNISRIQWINWNCTGGWSDALNLCNIILSIFHLITNCIIIR